MQVAAEHTGAYDTVRGESAGECDCARCRSFAAALPLVSDETEE